MAIPWDPKTITPGVDWGKLLQQDPLLQGQLRQIGYPTEPGGAAGGALASGLAPINEAEARARELYGGDSPLSTLAQLARNYHLQNSADVGSAAARGLARSGAVVQHLSANLHNYDLSRATEAANLANTLSGYQQQRGQLYQTALGQAQTAETSAYQRLIDAIQAGYYAPPVRAPSTIPANNRYPYNAGTAAPRRVTKTPMTNPNTFTPSVGQTHVGGVPSNRFQQLPSGYRAPLGPPAQAGGDSYAGQGRPLF